MERPVHCAYKHTKDYSEDQDKFIDELLESHPQGSKEGVSEEELKEIESCLQEIEFCFKSAPLDFMGTVFPSKFAEKEESDWFHKHTNATTRIRELLSKLSNSPKEVKVNYSNVDWSTFKPTDTNIKEEVQHNISEEEMNVEAILRFTSNTGHIEERDIDVFKRGAKWVLSLLSNHNSGEEKE